MAGLYISSPFDCQHNYVEILLGKLSRESSWPSVSATGQVCVTAFLFTYSRCLLVPVLIRSNYGQNFVYLLFTILFICSIHLLQSLALELWNSQYLDFWLEEDEEADLDCSHPDNCLFDNKNMILGQSFMVYLGCTQQKQIDSFNALISFRLLTPYPEKSLQRPYLEIQRG